MHARSSGGGWARSMPRLTWRVPPASNGLSMMAHKAREAIKSDAIGAIANKAGDRVLGRPGLTALNVLPLMATKLASRNQCRSNRDELLADSADRKAIFAAETGNRLGVGLRVALQPDQFQVAPAFATSSTPRLQRPSKPAGRLDDAAFRHSATLRRRETVQQYPTRAIGALPSSDDLEESLYWRG